MTDGSGGGFPWIHIPPVAEPGQIRAFANRGGQIAQLYTEIVAAGNAVIQGQLDVRRRFVVYGYMGVGKSSLILQTLGMLRDEQSVADGQLLSIPADVRDPDMRHRWLVLRASGKHVPSVDSIAEALRRCALTVLDDVKNSAERQLPGAVDLPVVDALLRTREAKLFGDVEAALRSLAQMIEYVHVWQGATMKVRGQSAMQTETSHGTNVDAELLAELKRQRQEPTTAEAKAAFKWV